MALRATVRIAPACFENDLLRRYLIRAVSAFSLLRTLSPAPGPHNLVLKGEGLFPQPSRCASTSPIKHFRIPLSLGWLLLLDSCASNSQSVPGAIRRQAKTSHLQRNASANFHRHGRARSYDFLCLSPGDPVTAQSLAPRPMTKPGESKPERLPRSRPICISDSSKSSVSANRAILHTIRERVPCHACRCTQPRW
jgi:hypothetical protein